MRYWKTHQKKLITHYLQFAYENKCKMTIWQQLGSSRIQLNAQLMERNLERCKIKCKFTDQQIDKTAPLFFHITDLDVIFKKDQFNLYGEIIDFPPPGEIQVFERRAKHRFYYKYQDHKNITFYSEKNKIQLETNDKIEPEYLYSCVLVDLSIAGAGMVVHKKIVEKISQDKFLYLQDITDQKLPKPFKVEIRYVEKYDQEDSLDLFKIGIKFVDELDSVSYKSITSIVEIKQKKSKGVDPTRFCGLDYEDQVALLNKIELTNRQLALNIKDNIDSLDRLRYMTTQMKIEFLQLVEVDLLANALRLSSKELIYELLIELTPNMRDEFLEKLAIERPASGICKAQDKVVALIRQKEASGEIVLDPKSFVTYV